MSSDNNESIAVFVLVADGEGGDGAHVPRHEVLAPGLDTPPPISNAEEETNTKDTDHEETAGDIWAGHRASAVTSVQPRRMLGADVGGSSRGRRNLILSKPFRHRERNANGNRQPNLDASSTTKLLGTLMDISRNRLELKPKIHETLAHA